MKNMKITKKEIAEKEISPRYLHIDVGPRYWEDGEVNGKDDIEWELQQNGEQPRMPFAIKDGNEYRWKLTIDLENGKILDWPKGVMASVHYKVCDDGTYTLLDENNDEIESKDCYVPDLLAINDSGFGDYIIFNVDENGNIEDWWDESRLAGLIEEFIKTEGF